MKLLILVNGVTCDNDKIMIDAVNKLGHKLIGFISSGPEQTPGKIGDYDLYPFDYLRVLKYDLLLLDSIGGDTERLRGELGQLGIPVQKVKSFYWLLQEIMTKKYEDVQDKDIQATLSWWKSHEFSVFNQHMDGYQTTYDELHTDESCGFPYINFRTIEGKERRMYFPVDVGYVTGPDGKKYVSDILMEQIPNSPHLYTKGEHTVNYGDVLIDAGVCEGNFALRYVDICSKIYLFEMEPKWFVPLYYSFRDSLNKVEFIPKAVSEKSDGTGISLDDAISLPTGRNVFLKMDIEGAEVPALRGAKNLLMNNRVRVSACSYHKADDCWQIKSLLQSYGYKTSTSDGYMTFHWDSHIWETADFRKGIVYASNY